MMLCLDLFLAGSKTTTDTLATMFCFLSQHPEWLKILQEDLDQIVGRNRAPRLSDRPLLPRVDAFLAEVLITKITVISITLILVIKLSRDHFHTIYEKNVAQL